MGKTPVGCDDIAVPACVIRELGHETFQTRRSSVAQLLAVSYAAILIGELFRVLEWEEQEERLQHV